MSLVPERRFGGFDNLYQALEFAARFPDNGLGFFDGTGSHHDWYSYADLHRQAMRMAGVLSNESHGANPPRVGLIAHTSADFITAFIGCQRLGWVPCVLPTPAPLQDMARYSASVAGMLNTAGASRLLGPEKILSALQDLGESCALQSYEALTRQATETPSCALPRPRPRLEETSAGTAYVQFSSGSTGSPKGIVISHRALMANVDMILRDGLRLVPSDRAFSWLPFYHDMGLVGMVLASICGQVSVDYLAPSSFIRRPGLWPTLMARQGSSVTFAPGFAYAMAAQPRALMPEEASLTALRIAGVGGDRLRLKELAPFAERYGPQGFNANAFKPCYGLAEATLAVSMSKAPFSQLQQWFHMDDAGRAEHMPEGQGTALMTCGHALPGWLLHVTDAAGLPLAPMQVGEIRLHGPSQLQATLHTGALRAFPAEQQIATGDLGFVTATGELFVTGRKKDLIIVRGRNISPADVENAVAEALRIDRDDLMLLQPLGQDHEHDREHRPGQETPPLILLVHRKVWAQLSPESAHASLTSAVVQAARVQVHVQPVDNGLIEKTSSGKKARAATSQRYADMQCAEARHPIS